jgi:hypothetical protein
MPVGYEFLLKIEQAFYNLEHTFAKLYLVRFA